MRQLGSVYRLFLLSVVALSQTACNNNDKKVDMLKIYTPFKFSLEMNPRKIVTIGDQILSEHIFASHTVRNPKLGMTDVLSEVNIDRVNNKIKLKIKDNIYFSDGSILSISDLCISIEKSFESTSHSQLKSLFKELKVDGNLIEISMVKVPNNMEALLAIPDFFIYSDKFLPVSSKLSNPTTGAYQLKELGADKISLEINKYYPQHLRANTIENVEILRTSKDNLTEFLNNHDHSSRFLAYFGGYHINSDDISFLDKSNLIYSVFPNEWVYVIGFNNTKMPLKDRKTLSSLVFSNKDEILKDSPLSQRAFSVSPNDKPFGLRSDVLKVEKNISKLRLSNTFSIGIRKRDIEQNIVKNLVSVLSGIENLKIVFYDNVDDIYSKSDLYLGIQGISAGDPVHHLNFFLKYDPLFKEILTIEELNTVSLIESNEDFNFQVQKLEKKVYDNTSIIPIAHFPGIVIHSKDLKEDTSLVGDWGIRAWTYQLLE